MELLLLDKKLRQILRRIPQVIHSIRDLNIETKSSYTDLVTAVDKGVEEYVTNQIKENFPQGDILGEETWDENKEYPTENLFVIDPIDGTTNFVKQKQSFCSILTYFKDGKAQLSYIYDIKEDILYSFIRDMGFFIDDIKQEPPADIQLKDAIASIDIKRLFGTDIAEELITKCFAPRILGSAGLEGARIATGKIGVYVNANGGPWDFSAYYLIAKELGIHFSDLDGKIPDPTKKSNFIISTKNIARELGILKD